MHIGDQIRNEYFIKVFLYRLVNIATLIGKIINCWFDSEVPSSWPSISIISFDKFCFGSRDFDEIFNSRQKKKTLCSHRKLFIVIISILFLFCFVCISFFLTMFNVHLSLARCLTSFCPRAKNEAFHWSSLKISRGKKIINKIHEILIYSPKIGFNWLHTWNASLFNDVDHYGAYLFADICNCWKSSKLFIASYETTFHYFFNYFFLLASLWIEFFRYLNFQCIIPSLTKLLLFCGEIKNSFLNTFRAMHRCLNWGYFSVNSQLLIMFVWLFE